MTDLHPTFSPGQRVLSVYGESFTVVEQQGPNGSSVLVEDSHGQRQHFHSSKLRVPSPLAVSVVMQALDATTLGDAVSLIQDALGIDDGGVAAMVFSGLPKGDDSWPELTRDERAKWLGEWLRVEALSAA